MGTMRRLLKVLRIVAYVVGVTAALGVILFFMALDPPDTPDSVADLGELEEFLNDLVGSGSPPGLTVSVIKNGAVVYAKGFGLADGPNGAAAREDTVYSWWSMTKIPTAVAILQLHEQGLLDIDNPVADYLPFFDVEYPSPGSEIITVRHLLNHSSGIPNNVPAVLFWFHSEGRAAPDQTQIVIEKLPDYSTLAYEPGSQATYTNVGYMLLGAIIEGVSGKLYSEYVRDHVLLPLGMDRTNFDYTDDMRALAAVPSHPLIDPITPLVPFLVDVREVEALRLIWMDPVFADALPPTGLYGPVSDTARLVAAFLNEGELGGQRILAPETVAMMLHDSHLAGKGRELSAPGIKQGLGWQVYENYRNSGRTLFEHSGGGPGFAAFMRIYPAEELGVVIQSNGTYLDREGVADLFASLDW